jgi:hypothetical protein
MSSKPAPPQAREDKQPAQPAPAEEAGTNAVEHEPDPQAEPIPDGHHKHVPRSPYTTGNY